MRRTGRFALDRPLVYGEVKKWNANISQIEINTLGTALHLFHTTVTLNSSGTWTPDDLLITEAGEKRVRDHFQGVFDLIMPPNSTLRVPYDYYAGSNYCVIKNYKTLIREGVGCVSSNTFKDRYQKTGIPLQLHELYGAVIAVSPHLQKSASKNQIDFQIGMGEFVSQVSIALSLLEKDICTDPDEVEILQLLQFYASKI